MGYNPRKRPEMAEITSFVDACKVVYRESQRIEILPGPEIVRYNPRKRPEMTKSRVLLIPLESCIGGHRASKSARDPKIMGNNP